MQGLAGTHWLVSSDRGDGRLRLRPSMDIDRQVLPRFARGDTQNRLSSSSDHGCMSCRSAALASAVVQGFQGRGGERREGGKEGEREKGERESETERDRRQCIEQRYATLHLDLELTRQGHCCWFGFDLDSEVVEPWC